MIAIKKKFDNIDDGIANMIAAANYDYNSFMPENKGMCDDFADGWKIKVGKKYIKIASKISVWGFVVNVDNDKKFKKGDVLMAAGWAGPARNKARGNVLEGGFGIEWTGPRYL
tara:strand:- start:178 stop:516 length:339 start_codon:yes stop_codon:yes gene_type:complete